MKRREIETTAAEDVIYRLGRARFGIIRNQYGKDYSAAVPLPLGFGLMVNWSPGDHVSVFFRSFVWAMRDFYDIGNRLDTREGLRWWRKGPRQVKPLAAKWDATGRGFALYTYKAVR